MKVADYISKSIQEYPSLYKDVDYEKSKTKVMDHVFFTIGNGLEIGNGYIFDPKYKRSGGEWEMVEPKPYGVEKYPKIPDGYFESKAYYVYPYPDRVVGRKGKLNFYYQEKKPRIYEAISDEPYSPYPICEYSFAYRVCIGGEFIHDDWYTEMKLLCIEALKYYEHSSGDRKEMQIGFLKKFLAHPGFN